MEIVLVLVVAALVGLALGRFCRRKRGPVKEPGGLFAGAAPIGVRDRDVQIDLEEGALDPDELEGEPGIWDEGADDEL